MRSSETYRAARRNAARGTTWRGSVAIKMRTVWVKPGKVYPRHSTRECERRLRQMQGA